MITEFLSESIWKECVINEGFELSAFILCWHKQLWPTLKDRRVFAEHQHVGNQPTNNRVDNGRDSYIRALFTVHICVGNTFWKILDLLSIWENISARWKGHFINRMSAQSVHYQDNYWFAWILFIQRPFDLLDRPSQVQYFCASAKRHPLSGSANTTIQVAPFWMYSLSSYSICPSFDLRLFPIFANRCTGFSSIYIW